MITHRTLALLLGVLAVTGVTVGSSGFSVADAQRGVAVAVADDEDALLGLVLQTRDERTDTEEMEILFLTNQFAGEMTDAGVVATGGDDAPITPYVRQQPLPLEPGENTVVGATCNEVTGGFVTVPLEITAGGPGFDVTKHLDVEVNCKQKNQTG